MIIDEDNQNDDNDNHSNSMWKQRNKQTCNKLSFAKKNHDNQ